MSDETASLPRIKITWIIATLLAFAIFAAIGAYSKRMTNDYSDYDQQRAQQRYATLAKIQSAEGALINPVDAQGHSTAEWVDEGKGIVRLPIEQAMEKEVDDLAAKAPAMGNPLTPPAPAAPVPAAAAPAAPTPPPGKPAPNQKKTPPSPAAATTQPSAPTTTAPNK